MNGKTILYVEDNEFNLKMVRQLLARTTYRLIEATDGELGVATALAEVPDLILMDIQLPKLSGLDATRRLRADPKTAAIPIRRRRMPARPHIWQSPTAPASCCRRFGSLCPRIEAWERRREQRHGEPAPPYTGGR